MKFIKTAKLYLKCFHFIGLSPIGSIHRPAKPRKCQLFLVALPIIFHSLFMFANMATCAYWLNTQTTSLDLNEKIIRHIIIICDSIRTILSVNQYISNKSIVLEIFQIFRDLESYFVLHLFHPISYVSLRKRYNAKCTILAMAFIQYFTMYIFLCIERGYLNALVFQFQTMQAFAYLGLLYATFYVDLLCYHIDQLITVIKRDTVSDQNNVSIILIANNNTAFRNLIICNKLNCYKNVHFRLWQIGEKINSFFGWHMVFLLLHLFVVFIHSAYRFISRMIRKWSFIKIFCKYFHCFAIKVENITSLLDVNTTNIIFLHEIITITSNSINIVIIKTLNSRSFHKFTSYFD